MNKKIVVFLLAAFVAFPTMVFPKSSDKKKGDKKGKVEMTTKDSASYAIGMEFAKSVKQNLDALPNGPYNMDILLEAFTKVYKNDTASLKIGYGQSFEFVNDYLRKVQEEMAEKAKAAGVEFLNKNKTAPGVQVTSSGLQYKVLKEGTGISPTAVDKVKVHYHGTLIDGTVFDSSVDRGEPITFELNKVIPGWTEGLQLMKIGSKYRFFIPQELGYGARGSGKIPAYSTLIFDVELLDVGKAAPQTPARAGAKYQFPAYQRTGK
jgi:FKBP-type peptidyl-prolyl cis-trans isomerase FklB